MCSTTGVSTLRFEPLHSWVCREEAGRSGASPNWRAASWHSDEGFGKSQISGTASQDWSCRNKVVCIGLGSDLLDNPLHGLGLWLFLS
jgi:hypothetical protein